MKKEEDWVLIIWIIATLIWDIFLIGGTAYLVFWKGTSGLWFILAILLGRAPTLYKVLRKKYDVEL